jgi:formate dehydrogenase maturation protein FdhE
VPTPGADALPDQRWHARAARARLLATGRPAVAETLRFYAAVADAQGALLRAHAHPADALAHFAHAIAHAAPTQLSASLAALDLARPIWRERINAYWQSGGRTPGGPDPVSEFLVEAIVQPFAEMNRLARLGSTEGARASSEPAAVRDDVNEAESNCPVCNGLPVVGVLREEGHGARRSLVCGVCLNEWRVMRLFCVACGEARFEQLPVFRAEDIDAARVDACETCRQYTKSIDLTRDGNAVPIVDDLATLPLDLWIREQDYHRARPNLLRL